MTTHDLGGQSTPPARLIQSGASTSAVVLDMSQVRFIDAAAVRVILSAHAAAAACGRRLYVDGLRAGPARVFELLGLGWLRWPSLSASPNARTRRAT